MQKCIRPWFLANTEWPKVRSRATWSRENSLYTLHEKLENNRHVAKVYERPRCLQFVKFEGQWDQFHPIG